MKNINNILNIPCLIILIFSTCTKPKSLPIPTDLNDEPPLKELTLKEINPNVSVGSPIDAEINSEKYRTIIKTELNTGQGLWYANWGGWSGEKNYNFNGVNGDVNWMKQNGISPTMHMLVGQDLFMPDWLIKGNWKAAKLDSMLKDLIYSIMDANDNKSKVNAWNVANELFEDDGSYRKNMVWKKMGWEADSSQLTGADKINNEHPIFIRKAFTYCREKTNRKLELRDYNIESNNPDSEIDRKQKAVYQLVKHMLNQHIPIDAVGIQGHVALGSKWWLEKDELKKTVARFKNLGVEVYITEMDVRIEKRLWTEKLAQIQKEDYYNYVKQAIEGGASRIEFWGIQDGNDPNWLFTEHPLPWDENYNRKPAYFGIRQALMDTK